MAKYKASRKGASSGGLQGTLNKAFPFLLGPLLFLAVSCSSRLFAVIFSAVALLFMVGKAGGSALRKNLTPLTLSVVLYSLVCLLSGLWCHYGDSAGRETGKILVALALFGLLLSRTEQVKKLLLHLHAVLSLVALLCLDAAGPQLLTRVYALIVRLFQYKVSLDTVGYESGIRITGIFSNANVSGGILALGLLLGLYLLRTAAEKKEKLLVALGLGVQALAFFLSFSMGSMAAFAVACVAYVICAGKGNRFSLALLMLECIVITVVCSFAAIPFLGRGMAGIVLWVLGLAAGALILVLDTFLGSRIVSALEGKGKLIGILGGALAVIAVVYVVLAFRMTGPIALNSGEMLERAVNPAPGAYTVSVDGADAQVRIYTQNEADLMMHTETELYRGNLSEATFTVPEDSRVVWFQISGEGALNAVTLSDGTALPLGYKLLPAFAANRLQALWANQNFIQRFVFFRDGIALWLRSPILGWGIGGVEGQLMAVQPFYYESKYIHNHFIQILDEAGIPGILSFLALLVSAVWLALKKRAEKDPLVALLAAVLAMTIVHSMVEVVWSTQFYQAVVFTLLAAAIIHFRDEEQTCSVCKAVGAFMAPVVWGIVLVFALLLAGNRMAEARFEKLAFSGLPQEEVLASMEQLDTLDIYSDLEYKTNAMRYMLETGRIQEATRCAKQLVSREEFDSAYYAAAYYCLPMRDISGLFTVLHTGILQERANPAAWNSALDLLAQCMQQLEADYMGEFVAGILETGAMLEEANASLMAPISLTAENQKLLDTAATLQGAPDAVIYEAFRAMYGE